MNSTIRSVAAGVFLAATLLATVAFFGLHMRDWAIGFAAFALVGLSVIAVSLLQGSTVTTTPAPVYQPPPSYRLQATVKPQSTAPQGKFASSAKKAGVDVFNWIGKQVVTYWLLLGGLGIICYSVWNIADSFLEYEGSEAALQALKWLGFAISGVLLILAQYGKMGEAIQKTFELLGKVLAGIGNAAIGKYGKWAQVPVWIAFAVLAIIITLLLFGEKIDDKMYDLGLTWGTIFVLLVATTFAAGFLGMLPPIYRGVKKAQEKSNP